MLEAVDGMGTLAMIYQRAGDHARALDLARREVRAWYELGGVGRYGAFFKVLAALELRQRRPGRAVRLAAAAQRSSALIGGELAESLLQAGDPLQESRVLLSAEEYARAVEEGRAMSLDEAVAFALEDPSVVPDSDESGRQTAATARSR